MPEVNIHSIGNATLILEEDNRAILCTDPWLDDVRAYFGSWKTSHIIPDKHLNMIKDSKYIWISHFHPDHLSLQSLNKIRAREKVILLSEQYHNRVARDLRKMGFKVLELPSRQWIQISDGIQIATFCVPDSIDSGLLVKANNCLVANLNDTDLHPARLFVQKEISKATNSLLLKLAGYGDADMINIYKNGVEFIEPLASKKPAPGMLLTAQARKYGFTHAMHFSSFHKYCRTDSQWANTYTTPESDLSRGWDNRIGYFKHFSSIKLSEEGFFLKEEHQPEENRLAILEPARFSDNWHQEATKRDLISLQDYLKEFHAISGSSGILSFRVGRQLITEDYIVDFTNDRASRSSHFTLHAPRKSMSRAAKERIFDDLLIGNFAKLYIYSSPGSVSSRLKIASKYIDNLCIKSAADLLAFQAHERMCYDSKASYRYSKSKQLLRGLILGKLSERPALLSSLKKIYQKF